MKSIWWKTGTILAAIMALSALPPLGCGGSNSSAGGCSVNGVYYPNGNAGNGQCTCPVIGQCTITWSTAVVGHVQPPGRTGFTTTVLSRNSVLITGGRDESGVILDTALLFHPLTGSFAPLDSKMIGPRADHAATLLPDGTVLLTGGRDASGAVLNTAELYDPVTGTFQTIAARLVTSRAGHIAMLLISGKILLAGGSDGTTTLDTAELYDPATIRFAALSARMITPREFYSAMLLPSGGILLSGGGRFGTVQSGSSELYDPIAQSFRSTIQR